MGVHKLPPPETGFLLVREFFGIARKSGKTWAEISRTSGVYYGAFSAWRGTNVPTINNFQAALNALGHELVIRKCE